MPGGLCGRGSGAAAQPGRAPPLSPNWEGVDAAGQARGRDPNTRAKVGVLAVWGAVVEACWGAERGEEPLKDPCSFRFPRRGRHGAGPPRTDASVLEQAELGKVR